MDENQGISYDAATLRMLEKIREIIQHYQSLFDANVSQEPLGLLHMAAALAHLPDPRLRAFPDQAAQWKSALDHHMTVLAELTQLHQSGIQTIQQIDSDAGRAIRGVSKPD